MYLPRHFEMSADELRGLASAVGSLELITVGDDGYPIATRLPFTWQGDTVLMHMARANPHRKALGARTPALAVITGPEAYVSPTFYATKAEHGRVVPTLNYSAIHLRGTVGLVEDAPWLHAQVTGLTDLHEAAEPSPWAVTDAPEEFVRRQLRAIVGVELTVEEVVGKAKRSQNRSDADRAGVIAGLEARGAGPSVALAAQMRADAASAEPSA
jgi:transcriptional regulator